MVVDSSVGSYWADDTSLVGSYWGAVCFVVVVKLPFGRGKLQRDISSDD